MRTSRKHSIIWIAATAAAIIGSGAPDVSAQTAGGSGPACNRVKSTTNIEFTSSGATNKGPGQAAVSCGVMRVLTTSPAVVTALVHDGNATNGNNVSCLFAVTSFSNGSSLFTNTQNTTGTFTGTTTLSTTIPTNTVGYVTVNCALPEPGAAESRLIGFNIQ